MNKTETVRMNNLNIKRVETTKYRVSHVIRLINGYTYYRLVKDYNYVPNNTDGKELIKNISRGINILETGSEELKWACEHFDWNDDVCFQIDDAIEKFGQALSHVIQSDNSMDWSEVGINLKEGLIELSKTLATLERWFDDDVDVSEV